MRAAGYTQPGVNVIYLDMCLRLAQGWHTQPNDHTTCTVAKALNVTFLGNSGPGEPRVLMTGFSGWRGFSDRSPAEAANSRRRCENPLPDAVVAAAVPALWCSSPAQSRTSMPLLERYTCAVAVGYTARLVAPPTTLPPFVCVPTAVVVVVAAAAGVIYLQGKIRDEKSGFVIRCCLLLVRANWFIFYLPKSWGVNAAHKHD